jgi:hypothetical protein
MSFIGSDRPYLDGPREATLRLVAKFPYHNEHGNCFHFHDSAGNILVWFSKRKASLEVGAIVRAAFVIYKHEQYNDQAQNLIRKFRILEVNK